MPSIASAGAGSAPNRSRSSARSASISAGVVEAGEPLVDVELGLLRLDVVVGQVGRDVH